MRFVWGAFVSCYVLRVVVCLSSLCVGSGSRVCPVRGSKICERKISLRNSSQHVWGFLLPTQYHGREKLRPESR